MAVDQHRVIKAEAERTRRTVRRSALVVVLALFAGPIARILVAVVAIAVIAAVIALM